MRELADLPEDLREQAMSSFLLLEPHLVQGRELCAIADGSEVYFQTLQR